MKELLKFTMEFTNFSKLDNMGAVNLQDAKDMANEIAMQENIINKIKGKPLVIVIKVYANRIS